MSNREIAIQILNDMPEYKMGYVLAYLEGLMADESADDGFCESLYLQYETDPDKGNYTSLKDVAEQLGVNLE